MSYPENIDIADLQATAPEGNSNDENVRQLINETMKLVTGVTEEAMSQSIIKDASTMVVEFIGDVYRNAIHTGMPVGKANEYIDAYLSRVDEALGSNFSNKE